MSTLTPRPSSFADFTIAGFTFTATGVTVTGRPAVRDWEAALAFANRAEHAAGWWVADLLRYADTRPDYQARLQHVVDHGAFKLDTVKNLKYLGESIAPARRRADVKMSLHFEVTKCSPKDQTYWLDRAATEGWSVRDLRHAIARADRPTVIEGQAQLEGRYRVIYADPPWAYCSSVAAADGAFAPVEAHYPTMTVRAIAALPVAAHTLPAAVLFLWCPAPILLQTPGPREVLEAWGFSYKSNLVWDKVLGNFGHYVRVHHEHLIIATRGSCLPDRPTPQPDSVQVLRRSDVHSQKPPEIRTLIERLYDGPRLELFARERHDGWTTLGNDARLWSIEARDQDAAAEEGAIAIGGSLG